MPKRKKLSASERILRRDELAVLVAADYDDLAPSVVKTLAKIRAKALPKGAVELMFEAFDVGPELNVVYRVLGAGGFLEQLRYGHVLKHEMLARVSAFSEEDMSIAIEWCLGREELFRRFPPWWLDAGGADYPVRAYATEHDGGDDVELAWMGTR